MDDLLPVMKILDQFRKDLRYCDVILLVKDVSFPGHRNILASWSSRFDALLHDSISSKSEICKLTVHNFEDTEVFADFMNYLYSGDIPLNDSNYMQLLHLATSLDIEKLCEKCANFIYLKIHESMDYLISALCMAKKYSFHGLIKQLSSELRKKVLCIGKLGSFLSLSVSYVARVISVLDEYLIGDNTETILHVIFAWVQYDPPSRDCYLRHLLSRVDWTRLVCNQGLFFDVEKLKSKISLSDLYIFILLKTIVHNRIPLDSHSQKFLEEKSHFLHIFDSSLVKAEDVNFSDDDVNPVFFVKDTISFQKEKDMCCEIDSAVTVSSNERQQNGQSFTDLNSHEGKPRQMFISSCQSNTTDGRPMTGTSFMLECTSEQSEVQDTQKRMENSRQTPETKVDRICSVLSLAKVKVNWGEKLNSSHCPENPKKAEQNSKHMKAKNGFRKRKSSDTKNHTIVKSSPAPKKENRSVVSDAPESSVSPEINLTKYDCDFCEFHTCHSNEFSSHLMTHYTGPPYKCKDCEYTNMKFRPLYLHRFKHAKKKNFTCQQCGQQFKFPTGLYSHMQRHSTEREKKFPCSICGKTFFTRANLDAHYNIHNEGRPYLCDICGFSSRSQGDLSTHKRIHSGRVYRCEYPECTYTTPRLNCMRRHKDSHEGLKQYQCHTCGKVFRLPEHLTRHESIHTGYKPFECPVCTYATNRKDKYREHMRKRHDCYQVTKYDMFLNKRRTVTMGMENTESVSGEGGVPTDLMNSERT